MRVGAGAAIDTPVGGAAVHASVGGSQLASVGAHVDTPLVGAGVEGKVLSRHRLVGASGYLD